MIQRFLLANGLAENQEITYGTEDYKNFAEASSYVNEHLAKKLQETEKVQPHYSK